MIPFLKVKGIRQRWLLNSMTIWVNILLVKDESYSVLVMKYDEGSRIR